MAGAPNPYGHQANQDQMPAFDPRSGKQKGGTAPKVWGIILIVLGGLGLISGLMNLASSLNPAVGMGMSTMTMPEDQKNAVETAILPMFEKLFAHPVFWISLVASIAIGAFSIYAGIALVKSKPGSWKLGIFRALAVLLVLVPTEIWVGMITAENMQALQQAMIASQPKTKGGPPPELMGNIMAGTIWGTIILTAVGTLAVNAVLILMMTRPAVKEFLDSGAGQSEIPGYDVTMGMAGPPPVGPGPAQQPQSYGQPENPVPPAAPEPNPDVNQPPPQT